MDESVITVNDLYSQVALDGKKLTLMGNNFTLALYCAYAYFSIVGSVQIT